MRHTYRPSSIYIYEATHLLQPNCTATNRNCFVSLLACNIPCMVYPRDRQQHQQCAGWQSTNVIPSSSLPSPIPSTKLWSSPLINMLPFITCCYRSVHRVKLLSARIVSKNLPWLLIDFVCLHVGRWWMEAKARRRCPSIFMTEYVQYVALVDMNVRVHRDRDWWFVSNEVTDGFDLALFLHR